MKHTLMASLAVFCIGCSQSNTKHETQSQVFTNPKTLADFATQDAVTLQTMAAACEAKNFDQFLTIFSRNPRVRESYSAQEISFENNGRKQMVLARDHYKYPLVNKNNAWLATNELPIDLAIDAAPADQTAVKWAYKPLDPTIIWTDDQLEEVKEKGELTFIFAEGCWRLTSDVRTRTSSI